MADTVIAASLSLNAEQATQGVKDFKTQLREAQKEVVTLTEKFGATSAEAVKAAKRAAELKDRIGDARKLVDSFNPDEKFKGVAQALTGIAGGFTAITGAMGLLGVQSEDVQKQLLKVQSALALTQGLNTIGDSIQSFKNLAGVVGNTLVKAFTTLKGAIAATGIGLLLVAIGLLIANMDKIKEVLFGIDRAAKEAAENAAKAAKASKEQLENLELQENTLRLQGKTEEQILQLKIKQTDETIAQTEIQAESQKQLAKSQYEAAVRNHAILKGIIDFITKPLNFVLETAAKVSDFLHLTTGALDKIKAGENAVAEKLTNFLFDPDEVKKEGEEAGKALEKELAELKSKRDGYKLMLKKDAESRAKDEKANADKRKELLKQTEDELEKIRSEAYIASFKAGRDRDVAQAEAEFNNEKKRIDALKLANGATKAEIEKFEQLKTNLLEENSKKLARRVKEIDDVIAKQREEEEKAALEKLMKVREDNAAAEIKLAERLSLEQIQQQFKNRLNEIAAMKIGEDEKTKLIEQAADERTKVITEKLKGEQKAYQENIQVQYENALMAIKLSKDTEEKKTAAIIEATKQRDKQLADLEAKMLPGGGKQIEFKIKVDDTELKNFTEKNNDLETWYNEQLKIVGDSEEAVATLQEDYENKKLAITADRGNEKLKIIADLQAQELDATVLNAEQLREQKIQEFVNDAALQEEQSKLKIEQDYQASLKEIEQLKASEETKTALSIEAKKKRDDQLAELEQTKIEKQTALKLELDNDELERDQDQFTLKLQQLDDWYKQRLVIVQGNEELTLQLTKEYEKQKTSLVQLENQRRLSIASQLLGQAANLFAKHTAAYKVLAIAQTTIDTYSSAISAYKSLAGIPVVGPALGAVAAGLAIANGLKAIKEIVKTKVPGADSGGGGSNLQLSTAAPTAPLSPTPQIGTTTLDQQSLNAVGNAATPLRAFVLTEDVNNNQERLTRLNRAARLTG